jgi:CelD/BcsL family acetyltransferase involved in cellulose biosynthesis
MMMTYAMLASAAEIDSIADEWRQLQARIGRGLYTDYDWVCIWWRTVGKNHGLCNLHIVTGREDDGRLVAVLPLAITRRRGLRILQAPGHGADACDMLCDGPARAIALWEFARRELSYDFAEMRNVYPDSPCYPALVSFARRRKTSESFYLRFQWPTGENWIASLPGNVNKIMRRRLRRLEEKAPVRFEVYRQGPLPMAVIDDMVKQKIAWSAARGKKGVFSHPNVYDYFYQFSESAARHDHLFLALLKCGNDTIAYLLCLLYQGALEGYVITYDPAWASYAPGILVLRDSICWAIDNGLRAFDHRQGGGNYKSTYSNEVRSCAVFTFSGSPRGRLIEEAYMFARVLWKTIKRSAGRLAPEEE